MKFLRILVLLLAFASVADAAYNPTNSIVIMSASAVSSAQVEWPGGIGVFAASGTFNGATISLQFVGPDGTTLITAGTATTLTAAGAGVFYLPRCLIQATITSAGGSTSLSASVGLVP